MVPISFDTAQTTIRQIVSLAPGHTVRYLGIEVDDALVISEQTEIERWARRVLRR